MNHDDWVLQATRAQVRLGKTDALRGLDCAIARDCVTVIVGKNGAGKSTLLRLALGCVPLRGGEVSVLGLDPMRQASAIRERVGYVPDVPDTPDWITPREWIRFLRPHYPQFEQERGLDLMERMSVPMDARFHTLSRGQGMTAMLAAAICPDPEVLLLDEPFAGLDPLAREEVLRAVIGEIKDRGRSLVVTTHDLDVASRIADRVMIMDLGKVTFEGPIDALGAGGGSETPVPEQIREQLAQSVSP